MYVDDILITGNDPHAVTALIQNLDNEFDVKDLANLSYFLGIQIKILILISSDQLAMLALWYDLLEY